MDIRKKIAQMPELPGVYLMKDVSGRLIYIGKAKSLKSRLSSYMGRYLSDKTSTLMSKVADIEYILCPSEDLALLLEAGLIQKHKPKYNVSLRDDKSFPYVKITGEDFPAISVARKKKKENALFIGPYTSAKLLRQALKVVRRSFPFRSCRVMPKKPCIYYRLRLCQAPCAGLISRDEYSANLGHMKMILEGKTEKLARNLSQGMSLKAKELNFEAAAKIRDQLSALCALSRGPANSGRKNELRSLMEELDLPKIPERIETFDISNISGRLATGAMVSFYNGQPDKNNYRRFRIKTVSGIDDYAMLAEVIRRRYSRLVKEGLPLPDLMLIDGGKAHLLVAGKVIRNLKLSIPVASIAKEQENVYLIGRNSPVKLREDSAALNLIRRMRDEAHRFALSYHHLLRKKNIIGR